MNLFLDLDGVFANFRLQLKLYGAKPIENFHKPQEEWTPEDWEQELLLTEVIEKRDFWETIPLMTDAHVLWDYCHRWNPTFLTAMPNKVKLRGIADWKTHYVRMNISETVPVIVCLREEKRRFSKPGSILVDDHSMNISEWNQHGGHGILHTDAFTTIRKLDHAIAELH